MGSAHREGDKYRQQGKWKNRLPALLKISEYYLINQRLFQIKYIKHKITLKKKYKPEINYRQIY